MTVSPLYRFHAIKADPTTKHLRLGFIGVVGGGDSIYPPRPLHVGYYRFDSRCIFEHMKRLFCLPYCLTALFAISTTMKTLLTTIVVFSIPARSCDRQANGANQWQSLMPRHIWRLPTLSRARRILLSDASTSLLKFVCFFLHDQHRKTRCSHLPDFHAAQYNLFIAIHACERGIDRIAHDIY